jgi:hypothetical protein
MSRKGDLMTFKLISILLASWSIHAQTPMPWDEVNNFKCSPEFTQIVQKENWSTQPYKQHVSMSPKTKIFRNFSKTIGFWHEIHLTPNEAPVVYKINDQDLTKVSFNSKCEIQESKEKWPYEVESFLTVQSTEDFTNKKLKETLATGKKGWIYFWSPKYTYSVTDMPRVERLAKEFKMEFIPVVDPRASKEEINGALEILKSQDKETLNMRSLASESAIRRNMSTDLYMRNGFNHFPVIYVYDKSKIHDRYITGVMTKEGLRSMTQTFIKELK